MNLHLQIITHDRSLNFDIMGVSELSPGTRVSIPGNAELIQGEMIMRKALGLPEPIKLILSFGTGVASSIVANHLYSKLKGRAKSIRIDRVEVELEKGSIKKVIEEHIESHGSD